MTKFIILALPLLFVLAGCKRTMVPPDPPKDPCSTFTYVAPKILVRERVGDSLVLTDKVLIYNTAVFETSEKYERYEWLIGEDEPSRKPGWIAKTLAPKGGGGKRLTGSSGG